MLWVAEVGRGIAFTIGSEVVGAVEQSGGSMELGIGGEDQEM